MRTRRIFPILMLAAVLTAGCMDSIDSELNVLERRIEKLEQRCQEINTTLASLRTIVEKIDSYDFVSDVTPIYKGYATIGYTIHFTHSDPVNIYNGTDAETPILGVAKGEDGVWYWTVKYPSDAKATFITDNFGLRIPTSAASPEFKIEDGYWMVTYDGGEVWHNCGRAVGEDGVSFFDSIVTGGDYVQFNLLNGTTIELPWWTSYEKVFNACQKLNENLDSFSKLAETIDEHTWVSQILPIYDGDNILGYSLVLSDGSSYTFYNGTGTNAPVIGAAKATSSLTDKVWYWTIRYGDEEAQWILDEKGQKIQANAPEGASVKITLLKDTDGKYYWGVAYGSEAATFLLYNGEKVLAGADVPDAPVKSVVNFDDDAVCITLDDGQTLYIPRLGTFTYTLGKPADKKTLTMAAGDTATFTCTLAGVDDKAEVLPVAPSGFFAAATSTDHINWKIQVIAPIPFTKPDTRYLNLLISNGYGAMKTVVITIKAK